MKTPKPIFAALFAIVAGCTDEESIPTLTTDGITDLTQTTVMVKATVTSPAEAGLISGFVWDTKTNPDLSLKTQTGSNGMAKSYSIGLGSLLPNTTYFVRAYATNKVGTGYGNEISFTTLPDEKPTVKTSAAAYIKYNSASITGTISSIGSAPVTERGIVYGKTDPAVEGTKIINNTGDREFTALITGLSGNTKYYARAYAINKGGIGYGNLINFTTAVGVLPTVVTSTATSVTINSASVYASVTLPGSAAVTDRGIVFGKVPNPTLADATKVSIGSGTGTSRVDMTALLENTTYFVRAYGTNELGTSYGSEISFRTFVSALPESYLYEWYDLNGTHVYTLSGNQEIITISSQVAYLYGSQSSISGTTGGYDVVGYRIGSSTPVTYYLRQGSDTNGLTISSSVASAKSLWKVVGRTVTNVSYGSGQAGLSMSGGNTWTETNDAGVTQSWVYTETGRSDWSVSLTRDDGVLFRIDVDSRSIYSAPSSGGTFTKLHTINNMY